MKNHHLLIMEQFRLTIQELCGVNRAIMRSALISAFLGLFYDKFVLIPSFRTKMENHYNLAAVNASGL